MDYSKLMYTVCGQPDFILNEALRLWKAKYPEFIDFKKDVITHENLEDFGKFVEECWDSIKPVTVKEAFGIPNTETRRIYFDCIGIEKLFKSLDPKLLDKQTIKKKRHKWTNNNQEFVYEFEDVYELYQIEGKKLFDTNKWGQEANPIYAVRCWCTTTNREYWLYVNQEAATGERWGRPDDDTTYDAIRAIAWTIRIDITDPETIYRQGDIIVAKMSKKSKETNPYHLNKEQYLSLMYSET